MTSPQWDSLSSHAIGAAGVLYFLALLCHLAEWAALAGTRSQAVRRELVTPDGSAAAGGVTWVDGEAARDEKREFRREFSARLGILLTVLAVLVHLAALVSRGMAADPHRVPWGNMYEFTMSGTFVVAAAYVLLYRRLTLAWMAPLVLTFVLVVLMVGGIWLYEPVAPLTEALNSYWLVIHVVSAILATGAFTLGGMASAVYLVKRRVGSREVKGFWGGWLSRVPELPVLDRVAYRIHAFAFPVWTFAVLITGPIWAHQAWSSYWNWDPKEVWAFITWVVYAGYLHARATAGWKGRNAAILALVGVATLWFNFIGINYFSSTSQHSYALPATSHVAGKAAL
ncbi:c-type cytochrome biogenesis protein CcsB [Nocardioides sp. Kera G14]|uniref:c-type cytochrome biogenesis protein CcsB n=1 Tax=Nocardioides sp. Kera G14 TaxID=2884264 RepID=UPI001D12B3BA|nr:c-type cytochrome biogenesis protein CcsB [Nocardioides sp. Kera G14]UDY23891.1 c-type cytochrome biogenesis protein CcsB [Nocardioides sp. Kera G14]